MSSVLLCSRLAAPNWLSPWVDAVGKGKSQQLHVIEIFSWARLVWLSTWMWPETNEIFSWEYYGGKKKIRYNIFEDSNQKEIKENILCFAYHRVGSVQ